MDAFIDTISVFPRGLVFVGMAIIILIIAKLVQDFLTPYRIGDQLSQKDNSALALSIAGYYFGVIIVFLGALYEPLGAAEPFGAIADTGLGFTSEYWSSVGLVALYSVVGIFVLNGTRILVDKFVLHQFSTEAEIIEQQNTGTGAVEFGVYIATALVIGGSIAGGSSMASGGSIPGAVPVPTLAIGPLGSIASGVIGSLVFAVLGLIALGLFVLFYELTTSFYIHDEIERGNTAIGVALGGNIVAMGLIVLKAVFGEFTGWIEGLVAFALFAIIGFVLLLIIRFIVDMVLFAGHSVTEELAVDGNLGVAFIESTVVISVSLILFFAV